MQAREKGEWSKEEDTLSLNGLHKLIFLRIISFLKVKVNETTSTLA